MLMQVIVDQLADVSVKLEILALKNKIIMGQSLTIQVEDDA